MDLEFFENLRYSDTIISKDKEGLAIIEKLNSIINGDKLKQRLAICVLHSVLKKCNAEIFEEHATAWMRFIMRLMNTIPSEQLLHLCYSSLEHLIEYSRNIDKLSRDIATKAIDPLLAFLVGPSVPLSSGKLGMLKCLILHYPAACGYYRPSIQKLVISAIESDDRLIYLSACQLYTLLASCGTAGEKKNRLAENWINQFYHVTNSIIYYISKLGSITLNNSDDLPANFHTSKVVSFSDVSEKLEISSSKISSRLERLLCMLEYMISTTMTFEVQVPLLRLFKVFCELSNALHEELKDLKGYEVTISKLTDSLLRCIYVSLSQFKSSLLIFCNQITEILMSILHLTSFTKRVNVYQCFVEMLRNWNVLPTHSIDIFLSSIFNDVQIDDGSSTKGMAEKKENTSTLKDDIFAQSKKMYIRHQDPIRCQNAYAALKLLEQILISNGPLLSEESLNSILSNMSNISVNLYRKSVFSSPYSCIDNRLMVFKVLRCLLFLHHGLVQIPTAVIVSHFLDGLKDSCDKVKSYCQDNMLQYDSVMHSIDFGFYSNSSGSIQKASESIPIDVRADEDIIKKEAAVLCSSSKDNSCLSVDKSQSRTSADHVLAKETKMKELPRRSSAEGFISNLSPGKSNLHSNHPSSNILHPSAQVNNVLPLRHNEKDISKATISTTKAGSPKVADKSPRFCNSADQVLSKSTESPVIPHRPYSESSVNTNKNSPISKMNNSLSNSPHAKMNIINSTSSNTLQTAIDHFNNSSNAAIHIDDGSPSPVKDSNPIEEVYEDYDNDDDVDDDHDDDVDDDDNEEVYDDGGPVVISDSSEDDVACTKSITKFHAKGATGSNVGGLGNLDVPQESMFTPRASKRVKLNTSGQKLQYTDDDMDYILSTFNDESGADMIM